MARFLSLFLLLIVTSCCKLPPLPVCGQFDGIQDSLNNERVVSILLTHGMGGYSDGDPHDLICSFTHALGLELLGEPQTRQISHEKNGRKYGCLERRDYYNPDCGYQVRFYLLEWRRATWTEKSVLRDLDEASHLYCMQSPWNCKWRKQLLTDVVADVTLYLGRHDKQIRYPFKQAVRWIEEDAADCPNHDTMVITFSLGSGILLDALAEMNHYEDADSKASRDWFLANTRTFFMMSNQLPLIELNRMRSCTKEFIYNDHKKSCYCSSCSTHSALCNEFEPRGINWNCTSVGDFVLDKRKETPCFQLINFTDPNDLLGFIVDTEKVPYCDCGKTSTDLIQNVLVRNVKYAWFGKLANPAKAHQDYGENPQVLGMILHGMQCKEACD